MSDPHPLRLDRSRYHSSVHGEFHSLVRYWQDGLPFDAVGHLVVNECSTEQLATADGKAPRVQMSDVRDQMSERGNLISDIRPPTSEGDVNLELWVKGQAKHQPFKVFAAIRERYSKSVSTFADAAEFLANDVKLVAKDQISPALLLMGRIQQVREEP